MPARRIFSSHLIQTGAEITLFDQRYKQITKNKQILHNWVVPHTRKTFYDPANNSCSMNTAEMSEMIRRIIDCHFLR